MPNSPLLGTIEQQTPQRHLKYRRAHHPRDLKTYHPHIGSLGNVILINNKFVYKSQKTVII